MSRLAFGSSSPERHSIQLKVALHLSWGRYFLHLCVFSIVFWCYHENELIFKDRSKDPTEQLVLFKALKLKESVTDTGLKLCQQIGIKQHFKISTSCRFFVGIPFDLKVGTYVKSQYGCLTGITYI